MSDHKVIKTEIYENGGFLVIHEVNEKRWVIQSKEVLNISNNKGLSKGVLLEPQFKFLADIFREIKL